MAAAIATLPRKRHADQRRADDLQPRHHQEDADEQADRDTARHGAAGEAPQVGFADALAERLQPAAVLDLVAGRRVLRHEAADDAGEISHAYLSSRPCSRFQSRSFTVSRLSCTFLPRAERKLDLRPSSGVEIDR